MKIICVDSTDPSNVTASVIGEDLSELEACEHRDELRKKFESKPSMWFEVVPDDYVP